MTISATCAGTALPHTIVSAVTTSLDKTYSAYFSDKPISTGSTSVADKGACIAGIISFVGDESFSFSWILAKDTALSVAQKFVGFEIPFDSADMGDLAGELVNVIAGEIVAQLDQRRIKVQMSLPTVARGNPLELIPEASPTVTNLGFDTKGGPFWFRLAAARSHTSRQPGK